MRKFVFCILLSVMLISLSGCKEEDMIVGGYTPFLVGLKFTDKNGEEFFESEEYIGKRVEIIQDGGRNLYGFSSSGWFFFDWETMEFKETGSKNKWPFDEGYLIFSILRSKEPQIIKYQFLIRELYIEDVIEFHLEGNFGEITSVTVNGEGIPLSTDPEYRNGEEPVATVVI